MFFPATTLWKGSRGHCCLPYAITLAPNGISELHRITPMFALLPPAASAFLLVASSHLTGISSISSTPV